ncbi:hypothetical protein [Methylocystis parvus]|uniref:Uncharacterized protein n=1 Tax=Methylocystis parvus TaxID=134 RepID=A0A6B8MFH7_9HYPH|nr:hypothetical protein [Methylocystis parvus]QGM99430.1 hypothetical protein F7D14_19370 [Methylocystis parvus]WBK00179.1 hypothetical protein MMG94_00160 [Methylocystis parvus OBBP]
MRESTILKTILARGGERRLVIYQRLDGLFTYEEEALMPHYEPELAKMLDDYSKYWVPVSSGLTLCDSESKAEREARGSVSWLPE